MQNDSRGAGIGSRGQGRQTFFVDVERKKAQEMTGGITGANKPAVPANAKTLKNPAKKPATTPKASGFRSPALSRPTDPQYAGKDDPLSLREPPQGPGFDSGVQLYLDADYLNADVHPDSLLADVEALFVQERMLTEQVKWWQERARREQTAKDSLQASVQTQEDTSKQEVLDLQRRIAAVRDQQGHEDQLRQALQSEAAELRAEAKDTQQQADDLRAKLGEIANQSSPREAVKIRAAINGALFSTQAVNKRPVQKYTSTLDQASPRTAQKAFAAKPFGGGMGSDEVSDDDMSFLGGGGGGGGGFGGGGGGGAGPIILRPAQGDQGGSTDTLGVLLRPPPASFGGSLGVFAGMDLDEDDDNEFGGMFGDQSLDISTFFAAGQRR